MKVVLTTLPDVKLIEPDIFADDRGHFLEVFQAHRYAEAGLPGPWIQDNVAKSRRGVLRGLHHQWPNPQGKLVWVAWGEILDVAVDVRAGSPYFGQYVAVTLSGENGHQLWIPPGFAHGYCVISDCAVVSYKVTAAYQPEFDRGIAWDDADIAIAWPIREVLLSNKDAKHKTLTETNRSELPD